MIWARVRTSIGLKRCLSAAQPFSAVRDRGVPASLEAAHALWTRLAAKIAEGRSVGVHCRAGVGRSGLMAAGVLVSLGIGVAIAWQRTSQARGRPVPDTEEQRLWLGTAYGLKGPKGS